MSCLFTRMFSLPRRKLRQESDTPRVTERNFTGTNITRRSQRSHLRRLASPPDCFPSPAANCNRKATQLASPNATSPTATSRAADTFHTANVLPLHPIVFLPPPQTATEKQHNSHRRTQESNASKEHHNLHCRHKRSANRSKCERNNVKVDKR